MLLNARRISKQIERPPLETFLAGQLGAPDWTACRDFTCWPAQSKHSGRIRTLFWCRCTSRSALQLAMVIKISAATRHGDNAAYVMLPGKHMAFGLVPRTRALDFFSKSCFEKYFQSFGSTWSGGQSHGNLYAYRSWPLSCVVSSSNSFL